MAWNRVEESPVSVPGEGSGGGLAQGDRAHGVPPEAGNLGFVFPVFCPNRGLLIFFFVQKPNKEHNSLH